jgi:V8-like Glu-specific endopeptidase
MGKPMWPVIHITLLGTIVSVMAALSSASAHATSRQTSARYIVTGAGRSEVGYWTKPRMESATEEGASAAESGHIPNPVHFSGVPTVGTLFFTTGTQSHFCTASVVDSRRGDIILTAAHCVYGNSAVTNLAYVPEWHDGVSPYGAWTVTSITIAQGWISAQDPDLDFAFLTVAPQRGRPVPIQQVTGGLRLGVNTGYNHKFYVIGYNNADNEPVGCAAASGEFEPSQMRFYCNDYQDGTSGGPWILDFNRATGSGVIFGDIGGYQAGGKYPDVSYSPYYGDAILGLFQKAQSKS